MFMENKNVTLDEISQILFNSIYSLHIWSKLLIQFFKLKNEGLELLCLFPLFFGRLVPLSGFIFIIAVEKRKEKYFCRKTSAINIQHKLEQLTAR